MNDAEKSKYLHTMDIFDEYERRFAEAKLGKKHRKPWVESDRQAIIEDAKALL